MTETIEQWNARIDAERAAKHAAKRGTIETPEPKTGSAKPFRRAREMYMSVLELKAKHQFDTLLLQALMNAFPQYRSRGHGGRHRTKNRTILGAWNQSRSKYMPHQGERECARRAAH
jgi:hypothetical protein